MGAQSLDDKVLAAAGRGHQAAAVTQAVALLKMFNLACGLQLMTGLPAEDWPSLITTGSEVIRLKPDFVRIYPTLIIAGTPLEALYNAGKYVPLTMPAAISRCAYLKLIFAEHNIPVIRVGLQPTEELSVSGTVVAGPYHPAFGELVAAYWFNIMVCRFVESSFPSIPAKALIHYHPQDHSKLRGMAKVNIKIWQSRYPHIEWQLVPMWPKQGELAILCNNTWYIVNQAMLTSC